MPNESYDNCVKLTAEQKREKRAAYQKQYRAANREHLLEYKRRHYSENRELMNEQSRQYQAVNREAIREKSKQYYSENRDVIKANVTKYSKANRDVHRRANEKYRKAHPELHTRREARRRAIKRNATIGDLAAIVAWESKWRSKKTVACHWCRKRVKTTDVHIDHVVPLSKGGAHSVENLCVSCAKCNVTKNAKMPEDWNASLEQPLLFV